MLGKIEGSRKKGVTEDEMVGWHHGLNGRDLEQTLGDGAGQGKPGVLQFMESQRVRDLVTEYQEKRGGGGDGSGVHSLFWNPLAAMFCT